MTGAGGVCGDGLGVRADCLGARADGLGVRAAGLGVHVAGDRALLIELPDNATAHAAASAARARWGEELEEVVPGHRTVLLVWRGARPPMDAVVASLEALAGSATAFINDTDAPEDAPEASGAVTIPVIYDGADLRSVAETLEISEEQVVQLHSGAAYTVAFTGFAPGFPYLIGGDPRLDLPRLPAPRTEVPAGSVAVAAGYCGIYPRSSPGGWNLLGRTDAVLFDPERDPPALLAPGLRVRFEAR
jgi:KipI family sensor histidine kinase inhibitor